MRHWEDPWSFPLTLPALAGADWQAVRHLRECTTSNVDFLPRRRISGFRHAQTPGQWSAQPSSQATVSHLLRRERYGRAGPIGPEAEIAADSTALGADCDLRTLAETRRYAAGR